MEEKNMEKNIISEEDLEKAAGGLKLDKSTLKKALIGAGVLAAGAGVAAGVYYAYNHYNKKGKETPAADAPHVYYHPLSPKSSVVSQPGEKGFQTIAPELPDGFKLED